MIQYKLARREKRRLAAARRNVVRKCSARFAERLTMEQRARRQCVVNRDHEIMRLLSHIMGTHIHSYKHFERTIVQLRKEVSDSRAAAGKWFNKLLQNGIYE